MVAQAATPPAWHPRGKMEGKRIVVTSLLQVLRGKYVRYLFIVNILMETSKPTRISNLSLCV